MTIRINRLLSVSICALTFSMLIACGGGAGDEPITNNNEAATKAVEPLVGVWDLPDNWNDLPNDEAYLVIKAPDSTGVSVATIYDLNDTIPGAESNCFEINGFPGTVSQSLSNELFLEVSVYPSAVAALTPAGDLEISVYSEAAGTGVPPNKVLIAKRLSITELEIPLCEN